MLINTINITRWNWSLFTEYIIVVLFRRKRLRLLHFELVFSCCFL
uniref:Uncharacterized protein n=1 Tax=Anguilla anguilla TaxID=7936 RepID=A0A0E9RR25_ANGAN